MKTKKNIDVSPTLEMLSGKDTKLIIKTRKSCQIDKSTSGKPLKNQQLPKDFHSYHLGREFLSLLFDGVLEDELPANDDIYLNIWAKDRTGTSESHWFDGYNFKSASLKAVELSKKGMDVYFGLGLGDRDKERYSRCKYEDVIGIPGLWLDIDLQSDTHQADNLPADKSEALTMLQSCFPLEPSIMVDSGNGLHAYWLFDEVWLFESQDEKKRARDLSKRFQRHLKDYWNSKGYQLDSTSDLARVLRVPGTVNWKDVNNPKQVTIFKKNDLRYNATDFEEILPALTVKTNFSSGSLQNTVSYQGVDKGGRNSSMASYAGRLIKAGNSKEQTLAKLSNANRKNQPPLPEPEVKRICNSIWKCEQRKQNHTM